MNTVIYVRVEKKDYYYFRRKEEQVKKLKPIIKEANDVLRNGGNARKQIIKANNILRAVK